MQEATEPANEEERVGALHAYDILDTLPEKAYDDIVFIASSICGTPIALVSLVDTDRQWFKARLGIDTAQTPRNIAFCSHAILEPDKLLIVDDTSRDSRFADNPLVLQQPKIRFYAGAPLITSEGHALGTLCVIDTKPRHLSDRQQEMLRGLSRLVVAQLELHRTVAELEHRNTQLRSSRNELAALCRMLKGQRDIIERDLYRAEDIQRSLLPHQAPDFENCYLQTLYRPGHTIGGDLYDVISINNRKLVLVVADAAGHGVSAAMLSVLFKHHLNLYHQQDSDPDQPAAILSKINSSLIAERPAPGVFITAVYCLVDVDRQSLTIASAGHVPMICVRSDGTFFTTEHTGPALGLEAAAQYDEVELQLSKNDRVLIYTDGLLELGEGAPPTAKEIVEKLNAIGHDEEALEKLLTRVTAGREKSDRDDVTLVLLNFSPGDNRFNETGESVRLTVAPEGTSPEIDYADTDAETFFFFAGRITWMYAQTLFDHAMSMIDDGRGLVLDFTDCTFLDSTLLGTLHELVIRAENAGAPICLQGVSSELIAAFEELSMRHLLGCVSRESVPVPAKRHKLDLTDISLNRQQARLLKAHEVLADLSGDSRVEFNSVIETLRSEIKQDK